MQKWEYSEMKEGNAMSDNPRNPQCPCKRTDCARYGDCAACQAHHAKKGEKHPPFCQRTPRKKAQKNAEAHKWTLADTLTSLRMLLAAAMMVFPPLSLPFFVFYTLGGLTDAVDGWAARSTGTASEFGARLDSVADLLFYGLLLLRLLPTLYGLLPGFIWFAVAGIVVIRLASYLTAAVKFHRFAALHTWLNKLTGMAAFLLPFALELPIAQIYCFFLCGLALLSSLEELTIHLRHRDYRPDRKSILGRRNQNG